MSKEISIHEIDINLIIEYFSYTEKQGPGSPEMTKKALSFIDNLTKDSHIADLGCGKGTQTMWLAKNTEAKITASDLVPIYIDVVNENAKKAGYASRVSGKVESMDSLSFKNEELDLVWSEGSIYNIGFERGLNEWHKLLKKGGHIAVSDACWFTDDRPNEIEDFWYGEYNEIDTIPNKVAQMQKAGYVPVATFVLPNSCWTENYYKPQVKTRKTFLEKHPNNDIAKQFVDYQLYEEEMFRKYNAYYGYVFFTGKKI